jgi:hypothetical protein
LLQFLPEHIIRGMIILFIFIYTNVFLLFLYLFLIENDVGVALYYKID